ncbi:hypothetical protein NZK27_10910 [Synechococcus sp. FGCU-3]|nr:hypothetical protein [Synechococcus sp. FGCU3]
MKRLLPLPALLASVVLPGVSAAAGSLPPPAGLMNCPTPAPGRYALLGSGQMEGEPAAVLMQETWTPDGRVEGVRWQRQGRRFVDERYTGQVSAGEHCWAQVERKGKAGTFTDTVGLNQAGVPQVSLLGGAGQVLSLRYVSQPETTCRTELLDGLVTSQQQGQSWKGGAWQPNAVVQREWWQAGIVQGLAYSSYGGQQEQVTYSGRLQVGKDCLGRMVQRDSKGVTYNYRVLVLPSGGGYFYLQTDPDDLTLGLLQRQR